MAEISSGNEDKSVGKSSSFKLFGRSPSGTPKRSSSKKKSNPISRLFSRKNSEKQNIANYESDSSSNNDGDTGKPDETDASSLSQKTKIDVHKVTQVASHGIQTFVQEMTNANTIPESKESIPASDEKKADIVTKVKEVAENSEEEIVEKGKEGLKEVLKAINTAAAAASSSSTNEEAEEEKLKKGKEQQTSSHGKEEKPSNNKNDMDDHDASDDQKKIIPASQEKMKNSSTLNTADAATTVNTTAAPNQKLQQEETSRHGREENIDQENETKQEDNCVASLAEGLQKMCAPAWTQDNKHDD